MTIGRKIASLFAILTLTGFLAACDNTIRGIGKDINQSAKAVEDSTE